MGSIKDFIPTLGPLKSMFKFSAKTLIQHYCKQFINNFDAQKQVEFLSSSLNENNVLIKEISLNSRAINDALPPSLNLPIEFVEGWIGLADVTMKLASPRKLSIIITDVILTLNIANICPVNMESGESDTSSIDDSFIPKDESQLYGYMHQLTEDILSKLSITVYDLQINLNFVSKINSLYITFELNTEKVEITNKFSEVKKEEDPDQIEKKVDEKNFKIQGITIGLKEYKHVNYIGDNVRICQLYGLQEINYKNEKDIEAYVPIMKIDIILSSIRLFLTPKQIGQIMLALEIFKTELKLKHSASEPVNQRPMTESDYVRVGFELKREMEINQAFEYNQLYPLDKWSGLSIIDGSNGPDNECCGRQSAFSDDYNNQSFHSVGSDIQEKSDISLSFSITINNFNIILLYEDLLIDDKDCLYTNVSIQNLRQKSNEYFNSCDKLQLMCNSMQDTIDLERKMISICDLNHLSLFSSPFQIKFTNYAKNNRYKLNSVISFGLFSLYENFTNENYKCNLLRINQLNMSNTSSEFSPISVVTYQQSGLILSSDMPLREINNHSIESSFIKCQIIIDFTLFIRLQSLLNISHHKSSYKNLGELYHSHIYNDHEHFYNFEDENTPMKAIPPISISLKANNLSISLRIPIPECKYTSPALPPRLRNDIFEIEFRGISFYSIYDSSLTQFSCEVGISELKGFYQDKPHNVKIPLLCLAEKGGSKIKVNFIINSIEDSDLNEKLYKEKPTIFYKRSVLAQCLSTDVNNVANRSPEEGKYKMILPADMKFVDKFSKKMSINSKINLEIIIPFGLISLPTNHIFEVIYNRFLLDLFVWFTIDFKEAIKGIEIINSNLFDSLSLSNSSEQHDNKPFISINVQMGEVAASIKTPYKENDKLIISKHGEVVISLKGARLFVSNGNIEDESVTQLFFDAKEITMHHQSVCRNENVQLLNDQFDVTNMEKIIYPSNCHFSITTENEDFQDKCLCLTMEMFFDEKRNLSNTILACGFYGVTLEYKFLSFSSMWFSQLADFFTYDIAPIEGYDYPTELMQINIYTSNSHISYNPVYLPVKTITSLGSFWLNFTNAQDSESLRTHLFLEDSGIFLSKNIGSRDTLASDFACVIDIDNFELCYNGHGSECDLVMAGNKFNIRTCSDSCATLMELIIYLSSSGDFVTDSATIYDPPKNRKHSAFVTPEDEIQRNIVREELMMAIDDETYDCGNRHYKDNLHNSNERKPWERQPPSGFQDLVYYHVEDDFITVHDNEFAHLGEEIESGTKERFNKAEITSLDNVNSYEDIDEDQMPVYSLKNENLQFKALLKELTVNWFIYAGNDFDLPSQSSDNKYKKDKKSNSLYDIASDMEVIDRAEANCIHYNISEKGGANRSQVDVMELQIVKINFEYEKYPKESKTDFCVDCIIKNVLIIDKLDKSTIKTFLLEDPSGEYPISESGHMVRITSKMDKAEINPSMILVLSIKPLKANIDQYALEHLYTFFTELMAFNDDVPGKVEQPISPVSHSEHELYCINIKGKSYPIGEDIQNRNSGAIDIQFVFYPGLSIKLDYEGAGIVTGPYHPLANILMGLSSLRGAPIMLKPLHYYYVPSNDRLLQMVADDWVKDIRNNQLPKILGGISQVTPFMDIIHGLYDLIFIPIEHYNKSGGILTGIRIGTSSFCQSSARATLDLALKFFSCVQATAEVMHDVVSQGPRERRRACSMASQPQDMRDGVTAAINIVTDGLGRTGNTIYRSAAEEHAFKGVSGAVGGVIRQVPSAVVSPLIIASQATCTVIGSMKNQLNPNERREALNKWKK